MTDHDTDMPVGFPLTGLFRAPHTLRFETPDKSGGEPATGDLSLDDGDVDEPVAEAPLAPDTDPADEPEGAPAIDWESTEVQERINEHVAAQLEDYAARYEAQHQRPGLDQEPNAPQALPDPLEDPDGFAQGLEERLGQMLDQRLGPVGEMMERQNEADAIDFVSSTIDSLQEVGTVAELLPAPKEGEEDTRQADAADFIELAASGFLSAAEAQYGKTDRAVQAAVRAGAQRVEMTLKKAHAAGRAARDAELRTIGNADDPGAAGGSATEIAEIDRDEMAWAERQRDRFVTS